jgi:hypothetical protein
LFIPDTDPDFLPLPDPGSKRHRIRIRNTILLNILDQCFGLFYFFFTLYLGATPENEIQIYTWMDASLKEITGLVKEVNPDARK